MIMFLLSPLQFSIYSNSGVTGVQIVQHIWVFYSPYCHKQYTSSTSLFQKAGMNSLFWGFRINSTAYNSINIPVTSPEISFPITIPSICVHTFFSKSLRWVPLVHIPMSWFEMFFNLNIF